METGFAGVQRRTLWVPATEATARNTSAISATNCTRSGNASCSASRRCAAGAFSAFTLAIAWLYCCQVQLLFARARR